MQEHSRRNDTHTIVTDCLVAACDERGHHITRREATAIASDLIMLLGVHAWTVTPLDVAD